MDIYHVNEKKSWLILKNENDLNKAKSIFSDLSIKITTEGQRHLGAALGSESFKEAYVNETVAEWHKELEHLSIIAKSQPQAACSAFINGYRHKFTYYVRTIPNIAHLLKPIEDIITSDLLPQILGFEISLLDREIFALPTRLGGLGIPTLTTEADFEYNASKTLSAPLAALIVTQNMFALPDEETLIMEVSSVSPRVSPPPPGQLRSGMIFLCEIPYPRGQIIV